MSHSGEKRFVEIINDPDGAALATVSSLKAKAGKFFLCLGSTATSDIAGISAAGVTAEARRLTPAIDAEALLAGRAISAASIPVSPAGIASPVVITRACLRLVDISIEVVDCGCFTPPAVPATRVGGGASSCLSTGRAMPLDQANALFQAGQAAGADCSEQFDYIVVGECVPGGTTTAMGVLTALGWNVKEMLSSSLPQAQHDMRYQLVAKGLERCQLTAEAVRAQPLLAVAALGDPMQPFVAGMAMAAAERIPVLLAGGSQMLAVFALVRRLVESRQQRLPSPKWPVVATTKWVAFDANARTGELSRSLTAPYVAACPDFAKSRHAGLNAYEEGNVKEGAGAGGAMMVAHAAGGFSHDQLMAAIDETYEELVYTGAVIC